ncbi:MAG: tetratricopeptide repeat protein [Planctomycetota bacterium]|jgi:tetratricopeptide (TPR) repeat protein
MSGRVRQRRWWVVSLVAAALPAAVPDAALAELTDLQRTTILAEAQDAYERGVASLRPDPQAAREAFQTATERYKQLVDDGLANGRLHYNLANAYLQAGEPGRAILHYRAAEKLVPSDSRLRQNLDYARTLVRSRIAPSGGRALAGALLAWHERTTVRARYGVFTTAWVLFWALLAIHLVVPRPWWRWPAVALAVVWLASGISVSADVLIGGDQLEGVVLAEEVIVRKGNGEGFEPQFEEPLYQGVEFQLLEQRPGWLHIELANDKTGWIRSDQAGLLG